MELSSVFQLFVSVAAVSCVVLAIGSLITKSLVQPFERVRCIQWTLVALLVAVVVRQGHFLPEWSVNVLPSESQIAIADPAVTWDDKPAAPIGETAPLSPLASNTIAERNETEIATSFTENTIGSAATDSTWSLTWQVTQLVTLVVFVIGAVWSLAVLCIGHWRLNHLVAASQEAEESMLRAWSDWPSAEDHGTSVYVSDKTSVPMAFGLRKPVILIPRDLANSDRQTIDYCLSHEWAHIKSRDIATWWALRLMQPLLWFQPLFWYVQTELRTAQDQLADNFALKGRIDRCDYAELLVALAQRNCMKIDSLALTMADRRSGLFRRIELLLSSKIQFADSVRRRVTLVTVGCLTVCAIVMGMLRLQPAIAGTLVEPTTQGASIETEVESDNNESPAQETVNDAVELNYSGKVIDVATEKPISGATVVVRRAILKSYERRTIEETSHQTDANGDYHFTVPPEQSAERSLYIELDVEHPDYAWWKGIGYSLGMIRKNLTLGAPPFFSKIALSPAEPVTGRIVDPSGNPLSNTRMLTYCEKGRMDEGRDHGSFMRTTTDQDGKFSLQMAKQGSSVFWIVPDEFSAVQIVSGTKRGDWGDIRVHPGVRATGKVVSATGEPVANVWVNLEDAESSQKIGMPVASSMVRSAKTAADGTFKLGPMKEGKYQLRVGDYGRELRREQKRFVTRKKVDQVFVSQTIELSSESPDAAFTIQAKPHVEFHAQFLTSNGEPSSGHWVGIFGQFNDTWFHTNLRPDKNGKILGKLPRGLTDAKLDAITNEHSALQIRLEKNGPLVGGRDIDLGTLDADLMDIEIIRYKAPIVQLKPVDEDGNVITEGVKVSGVYTRVKQKTMMPVDGLETNMFFENQGDGRHRSSQMLPDRETKFTVEADGYEPATKTLKLPEGKTEELALVLKKAR